MVFDENKSPALELRKVNEFRKCSKKTKTVKRIIHAPEFTYPFTHELIYGLL